MKSINRVDDLTGEKFGKLTVIGKSDRKSGRKTYWICQCECGNVKDVRSDILKAGRTKSCGCLKAEQDRINLVVNHSHKMSGTRIYTIWQSMKDRCCNPHNARYSRYGGRGIKVCDEWIHDFSAFYEWALKNGYSETLTIDRIDYDGNYDPDNCRWATQSEQARNRSTNLTITIGNATKTLKEWCEIFEVDYEKAHSRYKDLNYRTVEEIFNG